MPSWLVMLKKKVLSSLARVLFKLAVKLRYGKLDIHIGFIDAFWWHWRGAEPERVEPDVAATGQGVKRAFEEVPSSCGYGRRCHLHQLGRWLLSPLWCLLPAFAPKRALPYTWA